MTLKEAIANLAAAEAREVTTADFAATILARRDVVMAYAHGVLVQIPRESVNLILQFLAAERLCKRYTGDKPDEIMALRALSGANEQALEDAATILAKFLNLQSSHSQEVH